MKLRGVITIALAMLVLGLSGCTKTVCTCREDCGVTADARSADGGVTPDAGPGSDATTPADGGEADAAPPPAFSFVIFGDNQFATTSCTSGVSERMAVPEVVRDLQPTFLLHTGDLMDHGYDDGAYDALVSCYADMLAEIVFFPTPGNHDMGYAGIANYKAFLEQQLFTRNPAVWPGTYDNDFTVWYEDDLTDYCTDFDHPCHQDVVPSGVSFKTFYAVRHQNAIVLSFEQGTRWWTNTPTSWVETHLQAAHTDPTVDHKFVIMHHPMYSAHMEETHTGECVEPVRVEYEQLFQDYDVTIVFSGHTHLYDRFLVPDNGTHTRQRPPPGTYPHDGQAVHYLVTGGGGGPLPNNCNPPPTEKQQYSYDYSQARQCGYHVTRVEVDGARLEVTVIGVEGTATSYTTTEWDRFVIE